MLAAALRSLYRFIRFISTFSRYIVIRTLRYRRHTATTDGFQRSTRTFRSIIGNARRLPFNNSSIFSSIRNQGLFNYWTPKQLPNFALATPMFVLCFVSIYMLFVDATAVTTSAIASRRRTSTSAATKAFDAMCRFLRAAYAPHVVLLSLMCAVSLLSSHVQTHTRFVASSPIIYLCAARLISRDTSRWWQRLLVVGYFVQFSIIGTILFNSFYPWT